MSTSDIIPYEDKALSINEEFPVIAEGATCVCTLAHVDGCLMFRKTLKPEFIDKDIYRTAFKKEFEAGSKIENPNIVGYNKLVCEADDVSLYLDYIEGFTLKDALETEPEWFADPDNLYRFLKQLLCGMRCLHEHQLVHLDLNTSNIMLTKVNHDVKIIDLGYCYSSSYPSAVGTTSDFGAPELFEDINSVDSRADIYSFGKIVQGLCDVIKPRYKGKALNRLLAIVKRCSMPAASDRYMSVEVVEKELAKAFSSSPHRLLMGGVRSVALVCLALVVCWLIWKEFGDSGATDVLSSNTQTIIPKETLGHTTHADSVKVLDTTMVEESLVDTASQDNGHVRNPKHSFPFPAVVDDRNRIYAKILSTDDLSKISLVLKMVCNADMFGWQINVVLPDSTCDFLMENAEYHRLISKNYSKGGKRRYILGAKFGDHSILSRASDNDDDAVKKGEDDIVVTYFDGSKLPDGKYTVRLYDGIITPCEENLTHFITDEIILNFKISNGAVKSQNKFF